MLHARLQVVFKRHRTWRTVVLELVLSLLFSMRRTTIAH